MKSVFCLFIALCSVLCSNAQQYKPVDSSSEVNFTIKNFGINTTGSFKGLSGKINFSENNLANSSFSISLNANTINTGIDARDNHIKKSEYFDVAKYPLISFISTKITADAAETGTYTIFGRLNLKGVVKEISFPFKVEPKKNGLLFTGSFKINRKDFNIGGGTTVLSNSTQLDLKVFAIKN